jgi:trans-2,3-dihydro-3-hydroxyanthranilate isomerase
MLRKLRYHLVDVFTDRAFGGNQLAVFTNGRGLSSELMQSIAGELKLSETTFVLPTQNPACDYRVRIFTPSMELPMAGHPTIGTSFVLAKERMIETSGDAARITLELGVGPIPVDIKLEDGLPVFAEMSQPLPKFGPRFDDVNAIAEMLSIDPRAITDTNLPLEVVSCGLPFLFVAIRDLEAMRAIRFRVDVWERVLRGFAASHIFVFTREVEHAASGVHSRMFAPEVGILEDPATGGASGPLGCYLVRYRVVPSTDGALEITSEQGIEMGRPSVIKIRIEHDAGEIRAVKVGGQCRFMGEGFLEIEQ